MIVLCEPEQISLTNWSFRHWMKGAGLKIKELDERHRGILTNYGSFPGAVGLSDDIIAEHYQANWKPAKKSCSM